MRPCTCSVLLKFVKKIGSKSKAENVNETCLNVKRNKWVKCMLILSKCNKNTIGQNET